MLTRNLVFLLTERLIQLFKLIIIRCQLRLSIRKLLQVLGLSLELLLLLFDSASHLGISIRELLVRGCLGLESLVQLLEGDLLVLDLRN